MIANAIIIPTEQPLTLNEVKRALLTYDKVYIPSPDDRELIPPDTYLNVLSASLGFPTLPMGMPYGPIKPLGKVDNYDIDYERVIIECKGAFSQQSIVFVDSPKYMETISIFPTLPPDTPDPIFTYINYRQLSEDPVFVKMMWSGLQKIKLAEIKDISTLNPSGRENLEQTINGVCRPPKALLDIDGYSDNERKIISDLIHTRIGALVKYLGISIIKGLHPFTTDIGYAKVISQLENNYIANMESIITEDDLVLRQKRLNLLQNVLYKEYIDPQMIDNLSVQQILKLRTKAWGNAQENRNKLMFELNEIAKDYPSDFEFKRACKLKLKEFLKYNENHKNLSGLVIDLLFTSGAVTFNILNNGVLIEKLLKAPDIETLLVLGGLSLPIIHQYINFIQSKLKNAETNRKAEVYAIYANYKYLLK